jgi:two-component system chemotaxis response regulator CheB
MARFDAIVIGCSTGGLNALQAVLGGLEAGLPMAVLVCCHTGSADVSLLCDLLQRHCTLPVHEAVERSVVGVGAVHVAPSGYHLLVETDRHFSLSADAKIGYSRPSIDVLFASAAEAYGPQLIGVVLTGANDDGADGLARVRALGGLAIVQNPATAEAGSMPQAAIDIAGCDHCVDLERIAPLLNRLGST